MSLDLNARNWSQPVLKFIKISWTKDWAMVMVLIGPNILQF